MTIAGHCAMVWWKIAARAAVTSRLATVTGVARVGRPDWDSVIASWTSLQEAGGGEPFGA